MTGGGGRDGPPVIPCRTAGPARDPHSGYGAASCALPAVTLVAVLAAGVAELRPEGARTAVLVFAAVGNLVGVGLGIAGVTAEGRDPTLGSIGLIANVVAWVAAAGCCAAPMG